MSQVITVSVPDLPRVIRGCQTTSNGAAVQPNSTEKEEKPTENIKLRVFRHLTPKMRQAFGQDCMLSRLANACWGNSLIPEAIHDMVTDTNYEGEPKRAVVLLKRVYKKDKESTSHLKDFARIIKEVDQSHSDTAKKIDGCKTTKEFKTQIVDIADSLQASITRIADHAMAQGLISYAEYLLVADPCARHSDRCLVALFEALNITFESNSKLIDTFFEVTIKKTDDISDFAGQYKTLKEKALKGEPLE